jgi:hypothetical protein
MFDGLPDRHFRCVSADPDWNFESNSIAKPGRNARRHYACSSLEEICALPVERHAAPPGNSLALGNRSVSREGRIISR